MGRARSRALPQLVGPGDTLLVAHGALMRAVIGVLDRVPFEAIGAWKPGNCEAVVRELELGDIAEALARIELR